MIAHIFPGQGSQFVGMGASLFSDFKTLTNSASEALGYDLAELCLRDPENQLSLTQFTQPAIFAVSAMSWIKYSEVTDLEPNYLAGHSLGELVALFAADVFDFKSGIEIVKKRGEIMSKATGGGMLAVLGANLEQISDIVGQEDNISIANFNSDNQIVISGEISAIEKVHITLEKDGINVVRLMVSGAFHSSLMDDSSVQLLDFLNDIEFRSPKIPVVANSNCQPYKSQSDEIKTTLANQVNSPVHWSESIRFLRNNGVTQFREFGPRELLSPMLQDIA